MKRLPAEQRKTLILRVASRVFARSNFRVSRVSDIAAEMGVSEAAVYKHFPSKKAIFIEVLRHMSRRTLLMWEQEAARETDALVVLHNIASTYFGRMQEHPNELKVHFQAISEVDDPDIAEQLRLDHERYIRFISSVIEQAKDQGAVRKDLSTRTAAWMLYGGGILMNLMQLLSLEEPDREPVVAALVDHLIESMRVRSRKATRAAAPTQIRRRRRQ